MGVSSTACASLPAAALTAVALRWPNRRRDSSTLLRPISLLQRAQPPDQLYAGHWPGYARCSIQHGGSDHRRPSNVETGTPAPSLFPLQNTRRQQIRVESCIPLSTGVAWAAEPASNPAPPPTQVVDTTTHHMPLKLAQLAPPTLLTGPHIYKKSLTSRLCPCREWKAGRTASCSKAV